MMLNSRSLTSKNTKNLITVSISTHLYGAAFNQRTVLNTFSATLVAHKAIARGGAVFLFSSFLLSSQHTISK